MVTVVDYKQLENQEQEAFFALVLQGDIEVVVSKESGRQYITARKASLPCTFDELTCSTLIGKQMPGEIVRESCEPYEYTTPDGEKMVLDYTWSYRQEVVKTPKILPLPHLHNGQASPLAA